jgi:hypothetical protein
MRIRLSVLLLALPMVAQNSLPPDIHPVTARMRCLFLAFFLCAACSGELNAQIPSLRPVGDAVRVPNGFFALPEGPAANREGNVTTTMPADPLQSPNAELVFPHIVDSGGYTTQFILFSGVVPRPSVGRVRFFSQNGRPLTLSLR